MWPRRGLRHFLFLLSGHTMSTTLEKSTSTPEPWKVLASFRDDIMDRVIRLLEDRLRRDQRDAATADDIRACIHQAVEEFLRQKQTV